MEVEKKAKLFYRQLLPIKKMIIQDAKMTAFGSKHCQQKNQREHSQLHIYVRNSEPKGGNLKGKLINNPTVKLPEKKREIKYNSNLEALWYVFNLEKVIWKCVHLLLSLGGDKKTSSMFNHIDQSPFVSINIQLVASYNK